MAELQRDAYPTRGARFYREGEAVMFEFVMDPTNIIGPRLATKTDSERNPDAWVAFVSGEEASAEMVDARPAEPPAEPRTAVEPLEMDGFAARLEPAPERVKRKYVRRQAA